MLGCSSSVKKDTVKNAVKRRCYLTAAWFHIATNEEGLRTSWIFFLLFCTDGIVTECFKISYWMYDFLEFSILKFHMQSTTVIIQEFTLPFNEKGINWCCKFLSNYIVKITKLRPTVKVNMTFSRKQVFSSHFATPLLYNLGWVTSDIHVKLSPSMLVGYREFPLPSSWDLSYLRCFEI